MITHILNNTMSKHFFHHHRLS